MPIFTHGAEVFLSALGGGGYQQVRVVLGVERCFWLDAWGNKLLVDTVESIGHHTRVLGSMVSEHFDSQGT